MHMNVLPKKGLETADEVTCQEIGPTVCCVGTVSSQRANIMLAYGNFDGERLRSDNHNNNYNGRCLVTY